MPELGKEPFVAFAVIGSHCVLRSKVSSNCQNSVDAVASYTTMNGDSCYSTAKMKIRAIAKGESQV